MDLLVRHWSFATNVVMFVLAVEMGLFGDHVVVGVYDHVRGVSLPALGDQPLATGILWVYGHVGVRARPMT